jgi:hypothetical protein
MMKFEAEGPKNIEKLNNIASKISSRGRLKRLIDFRFDVWFYEIFKPQDIHGFCNSLQKSTEP